MFKSATNDKPAADTLNAVAADNVPFLINKYVSILGNLVTEAEIQLDGVFEGDVHCCKLVISKGARLCGRVVAQNVIVRGDIDGSIWSQWLTLDTSAHVDGDIYCCNLLLEQGAYFEGQSRYLDNPLSEAPEPAKVEL